LTGIFVANFFYWVNFTLSKELFGFSYSIFGYRLDHPLLVPLSFGVLASIPLLIGAFAALFHWPRTQYWAGGLGLIVALWAGCQVVAGDGNLLFQLSRQSDWWSIINGLPSSQSQMEPSIWPVLNFETLYDRIYTGWYYLGVGWYATLFTAIGLMAGAIAVAPRERLRLGAATAVAALLIIVASLIRPVLAQKAFVDGLQYQTEGRPDLALDSFRRAIALHRWYALNPRVYQRIGAVYAVLHQTNQPEYKAYLAERLFAEDQLQASVGDIPHAITLYDQLATMPGDFGAVARVRANDMRLVLGWHLFQGGAFGQAVITWDQVLRNDHYSWLAAFYAGMGYPTVARYQDLKAVTQDYLSRCGDPLLIGVLYNNLGDAEGWLGNHDAAHNDYYLSYHIDYSFNTRGASASAGPGVY
jgi:tetratricopeptide (TPR) repeat protein